VMEENKEKILEMVEKNPNAKILDLGCGSGEFTRALAKRICTDNIYGVEISESAIESAKKKGIKIIRSDLNNPLPLKDKMFNFICANQVIEHLYNTDTFVKEIYRLLKEDGYAIVSTPNLASFHNIVLLILGMQLFTANISNEIYLGSLNPMKGQKIGQGFAHLRIFTYEGLKDLFNYHNFKVEKIVGAGFYPFPGRIAKILSHIDKRHTVCLTIKVRKH